MNTTTNERHAFVEQLIQQRDTCKNACRQILERATAAGISELEVKDRRNFREAKAEVDALTERINYEKGEIARSGDDNPTVQAVRRRAAESGAHNDLRSWARRAATAFNSMRGESRAMTSGQIDVPRLVETSITPMARPARLIDLLVNRKSLDGNVFEFPRQTIRTNNAAPVADSALKPTSVLTTTMITDRAHVIAHLSEPTPQRLLADVEGLEDWLVSEMAEGVLDALEAEVIQGSGTGEHLTGLLPVGTTPNGTRPIAFATDVPTTLRKALTVMQTAGEMPNAVVLSPADAETIDLLRWGASGGFLTGGFTNDTGNGFGTSANIFGGPEIQRVISPSMPTGTAVLGDWSKCRLYVRESVNVAFDFSGDHFTHNTFIARGEGRFGAGWLRPSAFAVCDLTP